MKVAIPTLDKETIFARTGQSPYFMIFEINGKEYENVDLRENHHEEHDETVEHTHADLVEKISDCRYILLNNVGKHLKHDLDEGGIKIVKTKEKNIEKALTEFVSEYGNM
jgi:predicted Fe-Mo cluster-binding NifX family protein